MKVQISYGAELEDVPGITYNLTSEVADNLETLAGVLRDSDAELSAQEYDLQNLKLYADRAGTVQADLVRLSDRLTDCYKLLRGYYQIMENPPQEPPEAPPEQQDEPTEVSVETLDTEDEDV
jgi:hypothetical protein